MAGAQVKEVARVDLDASDSAGHVGDAEAAVGTCAAVSLLEVPRPFQTGVGRAQIDRLGRERNPGHVSPQVAVLVEAGLSRELLCRVREVFRHRIAPVAPTDLHSHAVEEEHVPMPPDLGGDQLAQQHDVAVTEHHAFVDECRSGVSFGVVAGAATERRAVALRRRRFARARRWIARHRDRQAKCDRQPAMRAVRGEFGQCSPPSEPFARTVPTGLAGSDGIAACLGAPAILS